MTERSPKVGSLTIRTYKEDYAMSDSGSENQAQFESEIGNTDDEEDVEATMDERLELNQQYMDEQISPSSGGISTWLLAPQNKITTEGTQVVLIRKPTASKLSHRLLNPFVYSNLQSIDTLNDLAVLLNTPEDWEVRYNEIVQNGLIFRKLDTFT